MLTNRAQENIDIFGTGELAHQFANYLIKEGWHITRFIDYDDRLLPSNIMGLPVMPISKYRENAYGGRAVIIAKEAMFASRALFELMADKSKMVYVLDDLAFCFRDRYSCELEDMVHVVNWSGKATISYLETNVVDHCNMNCRGCSHFSNIAARHYVDVRDFRNDLYQIRSKFELLQFRLLGGEPLLHPQLEELVISIKEVLPRTRITIATNGLLLTDERMRDKLLNLEQKTECILYITAYPNSSQTLENVFVELDKMGVPYVSRKPKLAANDRYQFESRLLIHPDNTARNDVFCSGQFCRFLRDGKISKCSYPLLSFILNEKFGTAFSCSPGDLVAIQDITNGWETLEALQKPISFCRYCTVEARKFTWAQAGDPSLNDYLAFDAGD